MKNLVELSVRTRGSSSRTYSRGLRILVAFARIPCAPVRRHFLQQLQQSFSAVLDKGFSRGQQLTRDTRASVLLEATVVLPITVFIVAGIAEWGLTMYEYHRLSLATGNAVRQLVINRGFPSPYTNVTKQFSSWSENMRVKADQVTVSIQTAAGGAYSSCNTDTACTNLLNNAQGLGAKVEVSYPCALAFTPKVASPCPLRVSMVGLVD